MGRISSWLRLATSSCIWSESIQLLHATLCFCKAFLASRSRTHWPCTVLIDHLIKCCRSAAPLRMWAYHPNLRLRRMPKEHETYDTKCSCISHVLICTVYLYITSYNFWPFSVVAALCKSWVSLQKCSLASDQNHFQVIISSSHKCHLSLKNKVVLRYHVPTNQHVHIPCQRKVE